MDTLTVSRWIGGQHKPVPLVEAMRDLPPDLLYFGYDTGEVKDGHRKYGEPLVEAPSDSPCMVAHCLHFITEACEKASRGGIYSYALKHRVEEWLREQGQGDYISTGAAIAAAILAGYETRRGDDWRRNPNATVVGLRLKSRSPKGKQPKRVRI